MKYIKSKLPEIIAFTAAAAVFYAVIALYRLKADAVLYAALLSLLILIPFFAYKAFSNYKKRKRLDCLIKNGGANLSEKGALPETNDQTELCYQNLIRLIYSQKQRAESDFIAKRRDTEDYYTLWAHQIKTPIAAMRLLLAGRDDGDFRECEAELFKIEQYVEMALGFCRLESESGDYLFKSYDIDPIVKGAVKKFSKQFILKKLALDLKETGIVAVTDEKWLSFVIEQIISNALKYTKKGCISVYGEGQTLCISDTGIGIASEDLPRIFEKGYTGCNGRTDKKATGLGLYLSKRITDKLGHGLSVSSSQNGTTVKIDLSRKKISISDLCFSPSDI
ncbi:MAG: sensor histidine kinase [Acutalibacteraceae bacterium]